MLKQFEMLLKWILIPINYLKTFVDENGLQRKTAIWKSASEVDLGLFPRLANEEVGNFTCGTYQLRLSSSYMQEHLDGESDITNIKSIFLYFHSFFWLIFGILRVKIVFSSFYFEEPRKILSNPS